MNHLSELGPKMQTVRLGVTVGLTVLFSAASLWVSAAMANSVAQPAGPGTGASRSVSNGAVITIGVGAAMEVFPEWGWRQVNAAQLAVDQANAAGGIDIAGTVYSLTLVVADDGCNPTQAITASNTLLNAGVVAVVGYTCSSASFGAQPIHAAAGVPMVSPSSSNPSLTEQGYTTTFRVITRDDYPAAMLATYMRDLLLLKKAAIVELDGFWGNWSTEIISTTFAASGATVTSRRTLTSTGQFTAALTAIQAEGPDVIFYSDTDANKAGLLSSVAQGLGMTDTIIAWNTFSEDEAVLAIYATRAGAAAEGDRAAMVNRRPQDMPGYGALNAAYQAAGFANYGDHVWAVGAFSYDAADIIIDAIRRAQSTNPGDIRDALASTANYQGVVGTYRGFDSKGDVIPQWAWLERYENGQWNTLRASTVFLPISLRSFGP
jgi:branched-chain amino acid transport system substrate-binding protein